MSRRLCEMFVAEDVDDSLPTHGETLAADPYTVLVDQWGKSTESDASPTLALCFQVLFNTLSLSHMASATRQSTGIE